MIISIDYDSTYSADPETFNQMIDLFQKAGHSVICVTSRSPDQGGPVLNSIGKLIPVIFANGEFKKAAARKRGYDVNVWVDDMPMTIDRQVLMGDGWAID